MLPFGRALLLRCPRCGHAHILKSWFALKSTCPNCALSFTRGEEGYQVGSYLMAMMAIEIIFVALLVGIITFTWPTPPWGFLQWAGPAVMLMGPAILFPWTKTIFLAIDLTFRPEV